MTEQKPAGVPPSQGGCVCMGTGPIVTDLLKKLGPDDSVKQHFRNARVEFLKGLRAMIDQRIADLSKAEQRGARVTVE